MAISAKDVMALRQRTGLGMMDCKNALNESGGDMEAAIESLRKKLKGKMDERSDRAAAEGLVAVAKAADNSALAMIELNCETDFVSRGDDFINATKKIAQMVLDSDVQGDAPATPEITAIIDDMRIKIQENISYARGVRLTGAKLGSYVHHNGKLGVAIVGEGDLSEDLLTGLCQHVAASVPTPLAVDEAGLAAEDVAKVKAEAVAEAQASGKPAEIAEKMATGKLRKWVDEQTLLGQVYVRELESKTKVKDALPAGAKVIRFVRYAVGA
jgi:elongation factor Ts